MFDWLVFLRHGPHWIRWRNVRASTPRQAARQAHRATGRTEIKVHAEDTATVAAHGWRSRVFRFRSRSS